jgi:hypothetical protein
MTFLEMDERAIGAGESKGFITGNEKGRRRRIYAVATVNRVQWIVAQPQHIKYLETCEFDC